MHRNIYTEVNNPTVVGRFLDVKVRKRFEQLLVALDFNLVTVAALIVFRTVPDLKLYIEEVKWSCKIHPCLKSSNMTRCQTDLPHPSLRNTSLGKQDHTVPTTAITEHNTIRIQSKISSLLLISSLNILI